MKKKIFGMQGWGHIGQDKMNKLAKSGLLGFISKVTLSTCEFCLTDKATRKTFGKATCSEKPLQLIHFDICSPTNDYARYPCLLKYVLTFTNDYTRYTPMSISLSIKVKH